MQIMEEMVVFLDIRDALDLSNNEYLLLEKIRMEQFTQPGSGWCTLSNAELAKVVGVTPRRAYAIASRLSDRGFLELSGDIHRRTMPAFYEHVNHCLSRINPS